MKILLVGATGALGTAVATLLRDRGHEVGSVGRTADKQVLHPVRAGLGGVLGDAPTRLAWQLREHPAQEPGEPAPGFHLTGEHLAA
jgi:uncharacterized protein YbjT (DUF2867 family)